MPERTGKGNTRMPLFVMVCTDKPGALERRLAVRPKHLEWIAAQGEKLRLGGPMMDAEGRTIGSLFLYEGESREQVEALAAQDPYLQAGIFESVILRPFRIVMENGKQVGA
jgi:uncharacterized protein YciI